MFPPGMIDIFIILTPSHGFKLFRLINSTIVMPTNTCSLIIQKYKYKYTKIQIQKYKYKNNNNTNKQIKVWR